MRRLLIVIAAGAALAIHVGAANAAVTRYHFDYFAPGASANTGYDSPSSAFNPWCSAIFWNEMYMQYNNYSGTVALIRTNGSWSRAMTDTGGYVWVGEENYQSYRKKAFCKNPSTATYWANCYVEYVTSGYPGCPILV